ncbi:hypothetical protein [Eubacterium aggregans]|uniref:hypothetical protein n=1 Tax=Eubacterium aggregans TaxID=81409 RepID=UPI003F2FCBAC
MKKKELIISAMILIVVCIGGAFGFTVLGNSLKGGDSGSVVSIVGQWTEDYTDVAVTFTSDGVFKIMEGDAATYTLDKENSTITLKYAQAYGGQGTTMTYAVTEAKLTLTNGVTGEVQTYTRQAESTN